MPSLKLIRLVRPLGQPLIASWNRGRDGIGFLMGGGSDCILHLPLTYVVPLKRFVAVRHMPATSTPWHASS